MQTINPRCRSNVVCFDSLIVCDFEVLVLFLIIPQWNSAAAADDDDDGGYTTFSLNYVG